MILAALDIENYKQFAGQHHLDIPSAGVVGVIGANGVGKTTLFEAIEWCLYNPREIRNDDVPPRRGVGPTRVRVTLEDPRDGARYVVERRLRRNLVAAEVWREDQPDTPIVQGSRQVTEYVARQLVGLGHRAFVSTFFTRQKELTFFGNLRETDRRREVGRLLGFETVRAAQVLIAEERTQVRAEAESLKLQHAEATTGRDFAAELAAADAVVGERQVAADDAATCLAAASEALLAARGELDRWRELERRDAELARELERAGGDIRATQARHDAATAVLAGLDEAAAHRQRLLPVASAENDRAADLAWHETERERFLRKRQLDADLAGATQDLGGTTQDLRQTVERVGSVDGRVRGWAWTRDDGSDPVAAAGRLSAVAAGLDLVGAQGRAQALARCADLVAEREERRQTLTKYRAVLDDLERQRGEIVAGGDPALAAEHARHNREGAVKDGQAAETRGQHAADTRKHLETLAGSIRAQHFDDRCPTCARPFSEHQAGLTLAALDDRIAALREDEARMVGQVRQAKARAKAFDQAAMHEQQRADQLAHISGRIQHGEPQVADAQQRFDAAAQRAADELARGGLDAEPTPAQVEAAQVEAALLQRVVGTLPLLQRLGTDARRFSAALATARQALADLGDVRYDPGTHDAARAALQEAQRAAATIAQIEQELTRRPEQEARRDAASAELARLHGEHDRLAAERAAVGFDPAARDAAAQREQAAMAAERAALDGRDAARGALRDAVTQREALVAEQVRLRALAERADTRNREADQLDQMYREFTLFDQYVANRVTPQLADHTGELLAAVTEGKYDHVAFDDNYGLQIYDGADECFPIEAFSGGERDVAALCARLALSRLIGGQASHPPSFLVLDEVFGALDRDRRGQTLETLGGLAGTADAFRQVFIISHVDDVRASPVFDEIWRLTEHDDVSRIENLTHVGGAEEG